MSSEPIASLQALVAAREARGLSAEDVQRQLKLSLRQIHALEAGEWSALPGAPYARGMLRQYGKLIGADVSPLLASIEGNASVDELLRPAATLSEPLPRAGLLGFDQGGTGHRWTWGLLIVGGLVALALSFGGERNLADIPSWLAASVRSTSSGGADRPPAAETRAMPSAAEESVAAPAPSPADAPQAVPKDSPSPAALTVPASPIAAPVVAAAQAPVATAPNPAGAPMLRMSFQAESWVEVRQADGKVVLSGLYKPGAQAEVSVRAPVSLIAGNAEGVRIEYDGKDVPVRLSPGATTARMTLP